jgi:hypothetical protein
VGDLIVNRHAQVRIAALDRLVWDGRPLDDPILKVRISDILAHA